jgi:hypothetical protein
MTDITPPNPPAQDAGDARHAQQLEKERATRQQSAGTATTTETAALKYARQTRTAAVFVAWVVGIFTVSSLIGGIIMGVSLIHAVNNSNGGGSTSNCASLGGSNPNC